MLLISIVVLALADLRSPPDHAARRWASATRLGIRRHGWHVLVLVARDRRDRRADPDDPLRRTGRDLPLIPLLWLVYMAICIAAVVVGAVVYCSATSRLEFRQLLRSNHTMTRDAVSELGRIPAPLRLAGRLARIPEQRKLPRRFSHASMSRSRDLPKSLDGLSILHLTDLHFHRHARPHVLRMGRDASAMSRNRTDRAHRRHRRRSRAARLAADDARPD